MGECSFKPAFLCRYSYESSTLEELTELLLEQEAQGRVAAMAFLLNGSETELFLCEEGAKKITLGTLVSDKDLRDMFVAIAEKLMMEGGRLDFLGSYAADHVDGGLLTGELERLMGVPVGIHRTLDGGEVELRGSKLHHVGSLFFNQETLHRIEESMLRVSKDKDKKLVNYEKIRTVGKGAFGAAILYRKKDDGMMVVIKEINMLDLSAPERQMALNEVKVLATLDHPNIVTYYDSFERDGVLMIEMEYADGGNLAETLAKKTIRIDEREIIHIFSQIVSAIRHMHENNVLHRDLKTANIFLTKEDMVKVGDFGISKMMATGQGGAHTVLGTPYYISPEMCEGKVYDEKSDIWALGCIIYEMACLQKTFEGSNLPALVNKIMKGQFAPIRGNYSPLFKQLVRDLLQREPEFRPSASEILLGKLPALRVQYENHYYDEMEEMEEELMAKLGENRHKTGRPIRSVLYYMKAFESSVSLTPMHLPPRSRLQQMAVSGTHMIALTIEGLVFTWGEGKKGQLGHGELENWRSRPACVEALKGKAITRVAAGNGFSVFSSDNGIVMTCGDGSFGALGHGDWNSSARPMLIEQLLSVDVVGVGAGAEHVVVVGGQGDVYAWGRGQGGRLGLGTEEDVCSPKEVQLNTEDIYITSVECGGDGTIFLSDNGIMYSCGSNKSNKLGLDAQKGWFFSGTVEQALVPTRVRAVKERVQRVSMGPYHTACLTDAGQMITFGLNSSGQLGRGHTRGAAMPGLVKGMEKRIGCVVEAGSTYTVCGTIDNVIHFWGTRNISPVTRPNTQDAFGANFTSHSQEEQQELDSDLMHGARLGESGEKSSLSTAALRQHQDSILMRDVVLEPQEILALYASEAQLERGHTVRLGDLKCQNQNIFLSIETSCPLPRVAPPPAPRDDTVVLDMKDFPLEDEADEEERSDLGDRPESVVPEWLKAELQDAKSDGKKGRKGKKKKKPHDKKRKGQEVRHPHAVEDSEQQERMKKMEKEYERRQQVKSTLV